MAKRNRRTLRVVIMLFSLIFLMACGDGESSQTDISAVDGQYLDFVLEESVFYDVAAELSGGQFLGMQYYQGEPVQLWASSSTRKDGELYVALYMYHQDGTRETVYEEIARDYLTPYGYLDAEGNYYRMSGESIMKLDASGKVVYSVKGGGTIGYVGGACQMSDGRMFFLVKPEGSQKRLALVQVSADGNVTEVEMKTQISQTAHLGIWGEKLLLLDNDYIYQVNLSEGSLSQLISFRQTSYAVNEQLQLALRGEQIKAFYMPDSGRVELVKADSAGSGKCESLTLSDMGQEKTVIVLRSLRIETDTWLKNQVVKFNSSNEKYYIVIEAPEEGDDWDDFVAATGVALAAGKGAEILHGKQILGSVGELIEKGGLENLAPLMEGSGIREEDYFPMTFASWRQEDAIYSISYRIYIRDRLISSDVLDGVENPDIETVVDALLAYPEKAIYDKYSAANILNELLQGSETLWGMVDWENGVCDFSGELFAKMLEAAKRYRYDEKNNYPSIADLRNANCLSLFSTQEEVKAEGYTVAGMLFDDGCHPVINTGHYSMLAINANAENKEGAWEFLSFILSEEVQKSVPEFWSTLPVKRDTFYEIADDIIKNGWEKGLRVDFELTEKRVEEMVAYIEDARALPVATESILEIICEEAQDYFDGTKEISQVAEVIENRVNLYLQETGN